MKNLKYIFILLTFGLFACQDYLDVNENPNAAATAPLDGLLADVTYYSAYNTYYLMNVVDYWVQYFASTERANPTDTYDITNASGAWNSIYLMLADNDELINFSQERGASHHEAIAKTLLAYHILFVADYWGAGPYTDAFKGTTATPSWQSGEFLYEEANQLLDEALTLFNDADPAITIDSESDLIYYGDLDLWKKAVYAIKARAANHLSKTGSYSASNVLSYVNQSFASNADDMEMGSFQTRNPWANVAINNENLLLGGFISDQFISALNGETFGVFDPRLPLITDETQFGDYRGTVNGEGRIGDGISDEECYLETTGYYSSGNAPLLMITYSELKFIEAEALLSQGNSTGAYTAYLEGIEANMDKIGVAPADKAAYLAESSVSVGASNLTMDLIFKEKWVALFLNPETWNDMRRHNYQYKDLTLATNALLNEFPRIASTPDVELIRNRENAIENDLTDRVWWDN